MADQRDSFFVGYLKMPTALKRFYVLVSLIILALAALTSFAIANAQKSAGTGVWQTAAPVTVSGLLSVSPYPVLHVETEAGIESHLMVMTGKFGADAFASAHHNTQVSVTGFAIQRGGWNMLEIASETDITPAEQSSSTQEGSALSTVAARTLGPATLTGEIIDSKCFLGVMKPGAGPVHRACAEVCLLGGIPPMLVVEDSSTGDKFGYIVMQPDGSSASQLLAKRAATQATLSGELIQQGDLLYLQLDDTQLAANSQ